MTDPDVVLVRATQTSTACPSQWDAWDADGNYYYLRYRSAQGSMVQYATPDWHEPGHDADAEMIRVVATFETGESPLDGLIGLPEFADLAGISLAPELAYASYGEHLRDELLLRGVIGPKALKGDEQR